MLTTASSVAAIVALAWGAVLAWLAIGAALQRALLQRRFDARTRPKLAGRRVLIMRPCAGDEPGLLDNLVSTAALETQARVTLVMMVDAADDGARPVIEAALARLRAAGLEARFELHPPTGPNRKASMLAAVLDGDADAHELVVNVDSNVDLDGYPLDEVIAPLLDEGERVGASWAPWSERRTQPGLGPRASEAVLGASLTAFPLLCGIYSYGLVGKIWAARREALDACEFAGLTHYLGEDLEMARRLRERGWGIVAAPVLARARGGDPSFAQVVDRLGRWMLAVRGQRPLLLPTYPLFFFATPLALALAGFGLVARPLLAAIAAGLIVFARVVVAIAAQYWSARNIGPLRALFEAVLGDVALGLAWVRALTRREVAWRGHKLRVGPGGRLSSAD
ncbi:hypothetical protein ENSA5_13720 [Enhygromyxa salina]|uniref:Ceramide glucosyltransferase n=1 Tax=Enhygromyxa salina TaxID=215803 RepID=A0A2S9YEZ8_9BACT|nr:glycosyltransferase [Enhygromyxa salina]PRQ03679.1 hypothetical protein ENSA5_13720 [Enhygromyxa salina]